MHILLIHGLGRSPLSMAGMAQALRKAGHTTELFGYTTVLESFDQIAARLRDRFASIAKTGPYGVVSHSMGGILTRAALKNAPFSLPAHVVMLAPPNQSPLAGQLAYRLLPFRWFSGQSGQNLASADFYGQLPQLSCPYTLVAGTGGPTGWATPFGDRPNDLIVSVEEVKMQPDDTVLEIPALHSFIMYNKIAQQTAIAAFDE